MATANTRPRLKFRADDLFFSAMATVALVVVLVGFAPTYFLAGLFRAPLLSLLVHIHIATAFGRLSTSGSCYSRRFPCWMRASIAGQCSIPTRYGSST